jgi:transposase
MNSSSLQTPKTSISKKANSSIKKGKPLTSQAREIVLNVQNFCKEEKSNDSLLIPLKRVNDRVVAATGVSERTLRRIKEQHKKEGKVKTPGKQRPQKTGQFSKLDNFFLTALRRKVHEYFTRKEIPNLDKLLVEAKQELEYPYGRTSLWRILREIGFKYTKRNSKTFIYERPEILVHRHRYLREIKSLRQSQPTPNIVYLDETWLNAHHSVSRVWCDQQVEENPYKAKTECLSVGLQQPSGKGQRLIITHAGGDSGFVPDALWTFKASKGTADYHEEMDAVHFEKWFKEQLIPNLPPGSIIVMDNAPYHSVILDKAPTSANRKADMQQWLTAHSIPWDPSLLKPELYELVKQAKPKFVKYKIDTMAEEAGHRVVRLPPYHCELNPIELIWANMKGWVARNNTTFKLPDVQELCHKAVERITQEMWHNACQHVLKEEEKLWRMDGLIDNTIDSFIIKITDSDSESDSDLDNCHTDDDSDNENDNAPSNTEIKGIGYLP